MILCCAFVLVQSLSDTLHLLKAHDLSTGFFGTTDACCLKHIKLALCCSCVAVLLKSQFWLACSQHYSFLDLTILTTHGCARCAVMKVWPVQYHDRYGTYKVPDKGVVWDPGYCLRFHKVQQMPNIWWNLHVQSCGGSTVRSTTAVSNK